LKKGGDNEWHEVSEGEALKKASRALVEKRKEKQGQASKKK